MRSTSTSSHSLQQDTSESTQTTRYTGNDSSRRTSRKQLRRQRVVEDEQGKGPTLAQGLEEGERTSAVEGVRHGYQWPPYKEFTTATFMSNRADMGSPRHEMHEKHASQRPARRRQSPWTGSSLLLLVTIVASLLSFSIFEAFLTRQQDPDGCQMSYMRAGYAAFPDFDTEHTRFASKYSLYLYREAEIDEDTRVKGVPVLFIPGNAGSYRQVRSLAAEAAVHYHEVLQADQDALNAGKRSLDWFTVDFNEDLAAFHGQTLLDQAEYLNEAIAYILKLYHNPNRSMRDSSLPDPTSVILVGHSMGGIVARTMLTLSNHQPDSVNTIVTLAAPHARPPVSFDAEIVYTYKRINDYWRNAYSQLWASDNPLWQVTLISIAGGSLDTIVPSDYATTASLVPPTHGFTVFTSTLPNVWTGMDHLAMVWCDQLRKSVVRALYDVIDAGRSSQTRPRSERMKSFKKWFLTGLEDIAEKSPSSEEAKTLLTLEDDSNNFVPAGERLVLRQLGQSGGVKAHLLPIPLNSGKRFTLLTNQGLGKPGQHDLVDVLFCSVFPLHAGQSSVIFSYDMDLSGNTSGSTRLACKNAIDDVVYLPASTADSKHPYDQTPPFSYLQFDLEQLTEYQFVAVIDKALDPHPGWLIAEVSSIADSTFEMSKDLTTMIRSGVEINTSFDRPLTMEIRVPSLQSSLLAYKLSINTIPCDDEISLLAPLVRQFIAEPYESKFFVNAKNAEISMHGVAPYMPPPLKARTEAEGFALQIWSDPTCNSTMAISLKVDISGSMGKLWMRYRTVFAAFPLLIVALVLRKQFKVYDDTGIFMSFSESMDKCLRSSIPVLIFALTMFGISSASLADYLSLVSGLFQPTEVATETILDFTKNDLLLGSQDPFFWFLIPLFGVISIGVCVMLNYAVLLLTHLFAVVYTWTLRLSGRTNSAFVVSSLRRRLIVTGILIVLVWTVIPYQFLFIVLCIAQLATCVRALSLSRENNTDSAIDFHNYAHSILILMLWILPINLPTLVVWIHNLTVHWLTPFSSHHNVLSILPFVLLVETLSTGKMLPRLRPTPATLSTRASQTSTTTSTASVTVSPPFHLLPGGLTPHRIAHHVTSILLFSLAAYAGLYGVTYAYLLHFIVNGCAAWLMLIYYACGRERGLKGVTDLLENSGAEGNAEVGEKRENKDGSVGDELEKVDGSGEVQGSESEKQERQKRESEPSPEGGVGRGRERGSGRSPGHSHSKKEP